MPVEETRSCGKCKNDIVVDVGNIDQIVYYKNKFYHESCFVKLAEGRVAKSNSPAWQDWVNALNDLNPLRKEAQRRIRWKHEKDCLNKYLIEHYNISAVHKTFWEMTADLEDGIYRGNKCRAITQGELLKVWQWAQKNLDRIAINNMKKNKGVKGNDRLAYDLAIIMKKIPNYLEYKAKQEAQIAEMEMQKAQPKINYNNISQKQEKTENKFDDISDLLDDIF